MYGGMIPEPVGAARLPAGWRHPASRHVTLDSPIALAQLLRANYVVGAAGIRRLGRELPPTKEEPPGVDIRG